MEDTNFRLYTFVNFYLSSIQAGIQSLHVLGEMIANHETANAQEARNVSFDLSSWAVNNKTVIVLNGGNAESLREITLAIEALDNEFTWAWFKEDEQSLDRALTACGIILPDTMFNAVSFEDAYQALNRPEPGLNILPGYGGFATATPSVNVTTYYPKVEKPLEQFTQEERAAFFTLTDDGRSVSEYYPAGTPKANFLKLMKSCNLAR
jgi:hypothetical protein